MKITFLGTGTSDGVPIPACRCETCMSLDARDKRMRSGVLIEHNGHALMIDASQDFRIQAIRETIMRLDALLLTHSHADHIFGLDELRQYNRVMHRPMPVYANAETIEEVKQRFSYFFAPRQRGGGVSQIDLRVIDAPKEIIGLSVTPLPVKHGILNILGYRINDFAFITDASDIPEATMRHIKGVKVFALNALRYREHSTHFNLQEAVDIAEIVGAKKTFFVHMTHDVKHARAEKELPKTMHLAYDGLRLRI